MRTYHAFIHTGRIKGPGIYPEYLSVIKHNQLVFQEQYNPNEKENSSSLFNKAGEIMLSGMLDFLSEITVKKLNRVLINKVSVEDDTQLTKENALAEILKCIPVYLVSSEFAKDNIDNTTQTEEQHERIIPKDRICTYNIPWEELKKSVEAEELDKHDVYSIDELLGLYEYDDESNRFEFLNAGKTFSLDRIRTRHRIFLWVDNIKKHAAESGCSYESLFFLVLCHEMMHAVMDVYSAKNLLAKGATSNEVNIFETYREESLANGLALYLFKEAIGKGVFTQDDYDDICKFVKSQPTQYQAGVLFQDRNIIEIEVPIWIEIKIGTIKLSKKDIYDWFDGITSVLK